jgi:hypothetical protein
MSLDKPKLGEYSPVTTGFVFCGGFLLLTYLVVVIADKPAVETLALAAKVYGGFGVFWMVWGLLSQSSRYHGIKRDGQTMIGASTGLLAIASWFLVLIQV